MRTLAKILALALVTTTAAGCHRIADVTEEVDDWELRREAACRSTCEILVECSDESENDFATVVDGCTQSCIEKDWFVEKDQCSSRGVLLHECRGELESCDAFLVSWAWDPNPCDPEHIPDLRDCSHAEPYDLNEQP